MSAPKAELTAVQRFSIERAHELITSTPQEIYAGVFPGPAPGHGQDYAYAWGLLKPHVEELLALVGELAEASSAPDQDADARMVGEVRAVLAAFDWEQDDRQYALEAIERIVTEASPEVPR